MKVMLNEDDKPLYVVTSLPLSDPQRNEMWGGKHEGVFSETTLTPFPHTPLSLNVSPD